MKVEIVNKNPSFFKLPSQQEVILFLIEKELRGVKLINGLQRIGFDAYFLYADLGVAIMSLMELTNQTDELWEWYHNAIDRYAEKVCLLDNETTSELALGFYAELKVKCQNEECLDAP